MHKGVPDQNILDLRGKRTVENSKVVHAREFEPKSSSAETAHEKNTSTDFVKKIRYKKELFLFAKLRSYPSLALFGVTLFILTAGFFVITTVNAAKDAKGKVLGASTQAFTYLQQAELALHENNRAAVRASLESASKDFETAATLLSDIKSKYGIAISLSGLGSDLATGDHILEAGASLAEAGIRIDDFVSLIQKNNQQGYVAFFNAYKEEGQDIKDSLADAHRHLLQVETENVPEDYREDFTKLKARFISLYGSISQADSMLAVFSEIFGFNSEQTYLLIFQNNQELRPTGGFIGSVARVTFTDGKVTSLQVPEGGSYDISGQQSLLLQAPEPMQLINPYFSFQDANWFPDFPTSSKKILEMYYSAGNAQVDGILAFTPDVLIKFLGLTGPVEIPGRPQVVDADNFLNILREEIEQKKIEDPTKPKKIIAELMPKLLEKVFDLPADQQINLAVILDESLRSKDIQVYAEDAGLEERLKKTGGLAGTFAPETTGQFIKIIGTNIAGGKTDRVIKQHVELTSKQVDGRIVNTITLTKKHEGLLSDPFSGVVNLSYLRFYVPEGSEFVSANGFYQVPENLFQHPPLTTKEDADIAEVEQAGTVDPASLTVLSHEFGMAVFGNWMRVGPGETTKVSITYRLPATLSKPWELRVTKQPGSSLTGFTWVVTREKGITDIQTTYPGHTEISGREAAISLDVTEDFGISIIPNE